MVRLECHFYVNHSSRRVGVCGIFFVLPTRLSQVRSSIRDQFSLMIQPRILIAFFIPALGFGATYAVFTYLVPILKGMGANNSISLILFGYGFLSIFSNILAGKIATHNAIEPTSVCLSRTSYCIDKLILDNKPFYFRISEHRTNVTNGHPLNNIYSTLFNRFGRNL